MKIQGKEITTIVSDLDGTLILHGEHEPSDKIFVILKALLEQGVSVIAASGRQYPNLKLIMGPIAEKIGFIAENGALVVWQEEVVHKCTVNRDDAEELLYDMKMQPNSEILVSGEKTSYILDTDPEYIDLLKHKVKNIVTIVNDFSEIAEDMLKISIYYPNGIPREAETFFKRKYEDKFLVLESGNGWLDFMPPESGKGNALKILSQKMNFKLENVVAFGDSENDISMLSAAGVSFAMSTASDQVKQSADGICESVESILEKSI